MRSQLTNYNLDGADNNSRIVDIQNLSYSVIQPSIDALQEFKIETSSYSAEYGYSAAAVGFRIPAQRSSGRQRLLSVASSNKQRHQRNQFGTTIGGPVVRNETFFFASWERTAENLGLAIVTTVPTAAVRSGIFADCGRFSIPPQRNQLPTDLALFGRNSSTTSFPAIESTPVGAKLVALLPLPNAPGQPSPITHSSSTLR